MKPVCVEHRRPPLDEKAVTTRLGQIVQDPWTLVVGDVENPHRPDWDEAMTQGQFTLQ